MFRLMQTWSAFSFPFLTFIVFISISLAQRQILDHLSYLHHWTPHDYTHPLDTISPDEVERTANLVKVVASKSVPDGRFIISSIGLKEPRKADMLQFFLEDRDPAPGEICRRSHTVLFDLNTGWVFEAVVDLDKNKIQSWTQMPEELHLQPMTAIDEESRMLPEMAKNDPQVQKRIEQLGYPINNTVADAWFYIYNEENPNYINKRIAQVFFYVKKFPEDNYFVRPLDFMAIVDVQTGKVVEIQELPIQPGFDTTDRRGSAVPNTDYQFDPTLRSPNEFRPDVKLIHVSQPDGVNFKVNGSLVHWQNFKFRVSYAVREGLIINTVSYNDKGKHRPLFYKLSLSELNLQYGDPRPPFHRKIPFDLGHYGLGIRANVLKSPEDCRGETHFFHGVGNYANGQPIVTRNAVCIYEEDAGVLWRKGTHNSSRVLSVRANRLAVMSTVTSGNYDYTFTWYFYQDAAIRLEVKLNGIVNPNNMAGTFENGKWVPPLNHRHGTFLAPQLNAIYHQHVFAFRVDADVDGVKNTVSTVDIVPDAEPTGSKENPFGNGWGSIITDLSIAEEARTNNAAEKGRTWLISVPEKRHPVSGTRMGYKLHTEYTMGSLLNKDSPLHPLCAFSDYDVWVTQYNDEQMYAGGFYLNKSGLPEWVGKDPGAKVKEEDVVLWHIFRATHIPRIEDFPVMPVETFGFWLRPSNFFSENPAFDISPIIT